MLGRAQLHTVLLTLLTALFALLASPMAHAGEASVIETTLIAEVDSTVTVTLDGETLEDTRLHRDADGEIYVDAMPIFRTLGNQVDFDEDTKALIVRRSQDGVVMELYTDTGIVKANGKPLGSLPTFGAASADKVILTPNTVAVLSGAMGEFNKENNSFDFELDARLRVTTGFDLIVNGVPIGPLDVEPRSVGPILLLPLTPIAEALGHRVDLNEDGSSVTVQRDQDSAIFTLDLDTGLVSLFDRPIGYSEDASYIDPVDLLLPVGTLETLTGTIVEPGDDRQILITLDQRLTDAIAPDGSVREIAANTPFAVEYAAFELGPTATNKIEVGAHGGSFNGRLRLELGELPGVSAELEPDWVSAEYEHISGVTGSVGDASATLREFQGVGVTRYRGVNGQKTTDEGRWAFAAGTPAAGRRRISDEQSRYDFDGLVAGARFADTTGWEAGLAVRHDPATKDQMAVLSAISGRLGRRRNAEVQWDASGAIGVFNGPSRGSPVDVRVRGQARRDVVPNVRLDVFGEYTGAEFTRRLLREDDLRRLERLEQERDVEPDFVPDNRLVSRDVGEIGAALSGRTSRHVGPLTNLAGTARLTQSRSGLFRNVEGGLDRTVLSVSGAATVRPAKLSFSAGATLFQSDVTLDETAEPDAPTVIKGSRLYARAYRDFGAYTARARVENSQTTGKDRETAASLTVSRSPVTVELPRSASLSVRPSITATHIAGDWRLRGGLQASVDSGDWLGEKTEARASVGIVQSVTARSGSASDTFLNVSLARQISVGDNMAVGLAYHADLRGDHRLGLLLRGRYDFARSRRLRTPVEDSGLLQGIAFLDENGDGERQDDEPGAGGVIVRVQGTRFALRTDVSGAYTVQNLRRGLYQISIDNRSLPLGYGLSADARTSVSVKDGQVSTVELPIQRFGQIRGSVFVDADESGSFDRGEERPEGITVKLFDQSGETVGVTASTSFGQFAFDALPLDVYTLQTVAKDGGPVAAPFTLDLRDVDGGMARVKLPLSRQRDERTVEATEALPAEITPSRTTGLPPP